MKEPPDKRPTHKTVKTSLKSIAKNDLVVEKLAEVAVMANKIVIHTLQFMKLYLIHCYDTDKPFPKVGRNLVKCFMKVLCEPPKQGRKPSEATIDCKAELDVFYREHYAPFTHEALRYTHMNTMLDYLADSITTIYENNIEQRIVSYIERFVNVSWKKREVVEMINSTKQTDEQKKTLITKLCGNLRKVKNDLLHPEANKTSPVLYHRWIDEVKAYIIPHRELQKGTVYYDVKCSPQDYLRGMVYMMKAVEKAGVCMSNVFPLRREIAPKYVPIDTTTLIHILMDKTTGNKEFYLTKGNLVIHQAEIWNIFFKTNKQFFHQDARHNYQFASMIETDGVGCSILLVREDLKGKRKMTTQKCASGEKYIDELDDYSSLQGKNVVGIDPNMGDLIHCCDNNEKTFRYTQDQRRKETKQKKYRDIIQDKKKDVIAGKTVVEWETELSFHNSRTLDFVKFKAYIKKKNEINLKLMPFYEQRLFRKLRLGSFFMRQQTEERMRQRFESIFGKPEDTIIGFGDYEQKSHMKYKEPVKGKGFRNLFRRYGYLVFLVKEFRTSCRCSACGGECATFRKCLNPRPWKDNVILRHGLLECKTCERLWNRDTNASLNINKICQEAIAGRERPEYLQRSKRPLSSTASVLPAII
jgi:hypothetical protein